MFLLFLESFGSFWIVSGVSGMLRVFGRFREFLEGFRRSWKASCESSRNVSGVSGGSATSGLHWKVRATASSADLHIGPLPLPPTSTSGHRLYRRPPHLATASDLHIGPPPLPPKSTSGLRLFRRPPLRATASSAELIIGPRPAGGRGEILLEGPRPSGRPAWTSPAAPSCGAHSRSSTHLQAAGLVGHGLSSHV